MKEPDPLAYSQTMNLTTVQFGKCVYRLSEPQSGWFQRSAADAPECSVCGDTLTFVFPRRLQSESAHWAGADQSPVAIRCGCFLEPADSSTLCYHQRLSRKPVAITAVPVLTAPDHEKLRACGYAEIDRSGTWSDGGSESDLSN
jgi:hypothetical protein